MALIDHIKNEYSLFRIIPHQSVLNSSNRKLWASLYELFSVKSSLSSRIIWPWQHQDGLKVYIRDPIGVWWITVFKAERIDSEEGALIKKRIEFFVGVPSDFSDAFRIKVSNHEQWKTCTLEEVQLSSIQIPDDVEHYQLTYERSNMFSLNLDYNKQTSPIRDLLSVSREISENDWAALYVRCEPFPRKKWKNLVDYTWYEWNRGGMPTRNRFDIKRIYIGLFSIFGRTLTEIRDVIQDTFKGIEKTFFYKIDSDPVVKKELFQLPNIERQELLVNGDLSGATKNKRNLPVFKTDINVLISSPDPIKRGMLVRSFTNAFGDLNGDNKLSPIKVNIRPRKEEFESLQYRKYTSDPNLMSIDELGKINQLPVRELQQEFREELEFNKNVEVEVPKAFTDESGIFMGTSTVRGITTPVYWPTTDPDMTFIPRAFIGSPRMGKDMQAVNTIVEFNRKFGIGAVVPDVIDERKGHRGMADALRDHLPPENVIDINLGDFEWPVYLGLHSIMQGQNERILGNRIAQEITNFLMGDDIENHQTREFLREFAKAVQGDLIGIKLMCLSKTFREQKIMEMKEKGLDTLIIENYHKNEGRQNQISTPILTRLGELLGDDFLKAIFGQKPNPEVNMAKWMQEGKVVIFRIPSRDLGEYAVKTIVYWITLITFLTGLSLGGNIPGCILVANEPHQFMTKGLVHFFKRLLAEGPKWKLTAMFLFHNFAQFREYPGFVDLLLSSSLNWHIFKNTNDHVYERLQPFLEPTFTPKTAMAATKRFHYIACWLDPSGEYQPPFMVKAPDLVWTRYPTQDNSFLTKRHSRIYGRHITEVINEIMERQQIIYT